MSYEQRLNQNNEKIQDLINTAEELPDKFDNVWDTIQAQGTRTDYSYAFAYQSWSDETFRPKYDIKPTICPSLFRGSSFQVVDLEGALQKSNIVFDTSNSTNLNMLFSNRYTTIAPMINMSKVTNSSSTSNANISVQPEMHTLRKIICTASTIWSLAAFQYATGLINLVIEGEIGTANFNLGKSTVLSHDSIVSVINALSDTTSGLSITLSKTAVNNAFGINVDDTTTYPEGSEYYILRHSKDNWTINYV